MASYTRCASLPALLSGYAFVAWTCGRAGLAANADRRAVAGCSRTPAALKLRIAAAACRGRGDDRPAGQWPCACPYRPVRARTTYLGREAHLTQLPWEIRASLATPPADRPLLPGRGGVAALGRVAAARCPSRVRIGGTFEIVRHQHGHGD